MNLEKIEQSFKAVYSPLAKAIGECLITLKDIPVDATAIISAIVTVAIDLAAKTNNLAVSQNKKEIIDTDHLARFIAFTLTNSLHFSNEMKQALDAVTLAGLKSAKEKPN
jgi:hypothetical protein